MKIWDAETGSCLDTLKCKWAVRSVAVSSKAKRIVSCSFKKSENLGSKW